MVKLMDCNDCKVKSRCKQVNDHFGEKHNWHLCAWVESYANQDAVKLRDYHLYKENMGGELPIPKRKYRLTPREKKIAKMLEQGLERSEIANRLGITGKTLRNIIYKLKRKYTKGGC